LGVQIGDFFLQTIYALCQKIHRYRVQRRKFQKPLPAAPCVADELALLGQGGEGRQCGGQELRACGCELYGILRAVDERCADPAL
jgi:hypothetical protein